MPLHLRSRRLLAVCLLTLAASVMSCVEGPFAHVNPNDLEFTGTMTLVSTRDTVSPANPTVVFKVVTDPVVNGWEPIWLITDGGGLLHRGQGVFELSGVPPAPVEVRVTAMFQERAVSRTIVRAPSP